MLALRLLVHLTEVGEGHVLEEPRHHLLTCGAVIEHELVDVGALCRDGWAFGGLTRILKHLPERHASYARYKALYVQMAESLAKRQQADGFWRSNLDDPEQFTMKESSGTGFFCYGIAWGINNGILNKERFLPVARKAWTALASVVNEDGQVGWSQPAGGGPGKVAEADTSKFGTGIFLLAASEIHLLFANEGNKQ